MVFKFKISLKMEAEVARLSSTTLSKIKMVINFKLLMIYGNLLFSM